MVSAEASFLNSDPRDVAPAFTKWLEEKGKVEYGKSAPLNTRGYRVGSYERGTRGVGISVTVAEKLAGRLEIYVEPRAISFIGLRPEYIGVEEHIEPVDLEDVRGSLRLGKEIGLTYHLEPYNTGFRVFNGRSDGHKRIPFP